VQLQRLFLFHSTTNEHQKKKKKIKNKKYINQLNVQMNVDKQSSKSIKPTNSTFNAERFADCEQKRKRKRKGQNESKTKEKQKNKLESPRKLNMSDMFSL
jgi:hypothetical protein